MAAMNAFSELRPPLDSDAALLEADRCLFCAGPYAPPPCSAACPAGIDVPRFVRQIADGRPLAAAQTIFEENLLGATCARVCPVEVLCQGACVLLHEGGSPIEIARLQRYATDEALAANTPLRAAAPPTGKKVAVVGAGPAGLACAGELAARGFQVSVFDEHLEVGGTVRTAIAPYRQVVDPLPDERAALARLGVEFRLGFSIASREDLDRLLLEHDAAFLGIGLGADRALGCPGTDLAGFWQSLDFIRALKRGVPPAVGDDVVVLGGGNTAIDVARESVRLGARRVTLAYRRTRELMPAYAFEVDEAEEEGVQFEWLAGPLELVGEGCVRHIVFERLRLGEPEEDARPSLQGTGERFLLAADTVVAAIGQSPRPEPSAWSLDHRRGAIVTDGTGRTSLRRVYAGGDAVNGGSSVVQAVAEGKRAAAAIEEDLCKA
jgi:glutamate synthase (NADPH/NADH) small chain